MILYSDNNKSIYKSVMKYLSSFTTFELY